MWFIKCRLSVVDRCCVHTNQLDLAIFYQPTGGIRVYSYMQTYKTDVRYKWLAINLDIISMQKCNSHLLKAQQISLFHVFVYYLVDSSWLYQEPCQCTTLKVLNRNGIHIVYTSSLKSKENIMEQRNLNWLLYLCNFTDDDLYEAEYEERDF